MTGRPTRKYFSNLDPGGVLKNSHSQEADALRVINIDNIVGQYWSHVVLEYNANDSVTSADFYYDKTEGVYEVTAVADVAGSLNGKYFLLNTGQNEKKYYVWYNVGGTGVDPQVVDREGIEIPIQFNESAQIVAFATQLILNMKSELTVVNSLNSKFKITNNIIGTSSIADFNTGFTFNTIKDGTSELVRTYDFPQQTDIRYVYNPYQKTFEVVDTNVVEVVLESSGKTPNVQNITMLLANTEYNFSLPDNTKKFMIRVRENDAPLKLKFEAGGNFIEVPRGSFYKEEGIVTQSVDLFFETTKPGKTVELLYWT